MLEINAGKCIQINGGITKRHICEKDMFGILSHVKMENI